MVKSLLHFIFTEKVVLIITSVLIDVVGYFFLLLLFAYLFSSIAFCST